MLSIQNYIEYIIEICIIKFSNSESDNIIFLFFNIIPADVK